MPNGVLDGAMRGQNRKNLGKKRQRLKKQEGPQSRRTILMALRTKKGAIVFERAQTAAPPDGTFSEHP